MHQLGMSSMMYTQDSEGQFARSSHSASVYGWLRWGQAFMPYLGYGRYHGSTTTAWDNAFKKFYHCPADQRKTQQWSYGKNVWFELESSDVANTLGIDYGPTYRTTMQVRHPAGTVEFGELSEDSAADHIMAHFWLMGGAPEIDLKRHGRMSNYSYLDGHVLAHDFKETFDISKPDNVIDDWNPGTARQ
jgi:prepilin-type processing-associated H-X9-DG protein